MKVLKRETEWKDLERADKIVIFAGVLIWVALETGCFFLANKSAQMKQNVFKTEMIKQR